MSDVRDGQRHGFCSLRGAIGVAVLALCTGCLPMIRAPRSDHLDMVAEKRAPLKLVATSGRTCVTDPVSYTAAKIGSMFECRWQSTAKSRATPTIVTDPGAGVHRSNSENPLSNPQHPWWWQLLRMVR